MNPKELAVALRLLADYVEGVDPSKCQEEYDRLHSACEIAIHLSDEIEEAS